MTSNEQKVLEIIKREEQEDDAGWGPTFGQIRRETQKDKMWVKGVLGSLTAKDLIYPYKEEGFPTVYMSTSES